ncbi:MAG: O-acetylhomoserine aminocarboxypropyltransferase/cysteine synthase [Clostridia bacterium]|nr:O-acetylhomoserine aminocarboxypropyltransferase/cysteine synthase [Clostridia bacterium]
MNDYKPETLCVQAGYKPKNGESRIPQICQSTTFYYGDTQNMADLFDLKAEGFFYSRLANPTVEALEKKIAALEGGVYGLGCASGMSAILLTAMTLCEAGDNIVCASEIYGGSFNLFSVTLPKFGIECRFFDADCSAKKLESLIDERTKFVFAETIANPAIVVLDFDKIAAVCKKHELLFIVDNTLATPILCRPFTLGANIVVHSTTKYIDGHAAALGGMIIDGGNFNFKGNKRYPAFNTPDESYHGLVYGELAVAFGTKCRAQMIRDTGAIMSPQNAFITYLGSDTLALRMERTCRNAERVAAFLAKHPKVEWVKYSALPNDKYHKLAKKYLPNGTGGMMSFGIKGNAKDCARFMESLKLITQETHVADARSCVLHPASTTHRQLSEQQLIDAGISANLVRLSVGIENADDIIADLTQALTNV